MRNIIVGATLIMFYFMQYTLAYAEKSRWEYEEEGHVIWEVNTDEKQVALTFDDGPHPTYTPEILDVLAKYDAKATFFVIGEHAKKYSYLIERQANEGHEVANHTLTHDYTMKTRSKLKKELEETTSIIEQITGQKTALYRPVGGRYNDLIVDTARENGYLVVMWSWHQDTEDWKRPGAKKIANKVLKGVKPGDIILFHDSGGDRSQTVRALEIILQKMQEEGYEFVTVSELVSSSLSILPKPFQIYP